MLVVAEALAALMQAQEHGLEHVLGVGAVARAARRQAQDRVAPAPDRILEERRRLARLRAACLGYCVGGVAAEGVARIAAACRPGRAGAGSAVERGACRVRPPPPCAAEARGQRYLA